MLNLHKFLPVILLKDECSLWLDPDFHDSKALKDLLDPFPDEALDYYQVSKEVNKVGNNGPKLISKVNDLF